MKQVDLSERLWNLAARVGKVVDALPDTRLGRHVAGQLIRSGTSTAPNYDESGAAESRDDFIHKLSIALKELRETRGWLRFIVRTELINDARMTEVIDESDQLARILGKSLQTLRGTIGPAKSERSFRTLKSEIKDSRLKILDSSRGFRGLDHLAIVVPSTEEALTLWRDQLGFPVVCSEVVNGGGVRLTHLDLGNTHLQLVEPLTPDHPLQGWLAKNGPGLHHFCFKVDDVGTSHDALVAAGLATAAPGPHQGTQGKRALFLTKSATQGVQVEITGR
jgi:methylmalonyl-CoA/ethylmalonyl-CoA epimerase